MHPQQIQLLFAVLLAVISLSQAIALYPDVFDPVEEQTITEEADARETLEEIERETFQEITQHQQLVADSRQYTPRKCCKIGKRVADTGMYCNIDLMQVQKKNNGVYRRKMKFHGPESQAVEQTYKTLMMRVEKCFPSKASRSMFSKCCEWQLQISQDLHSCKYMQTREERRECKQRIRSRE